MRKKMLLTATFMLGALAVCAQIPTNGLMVHYPFNNHANDISGNNRNASVSNTTTYTTGANNDLNGAIEVNPATHIHHDFTNESNAFTNLEEFTIATWVTLSNNSNNYSNIFEFGNGELFLRFLNGGNISYPEFGYYSVSNNFFGSDGLVTGQYLSYWQEWHHIALTSSVSGNSRYFKLYIDGQLYFSNTINGMAPDDVSINQDISTPEGSKFYLGYRPGNTNLDLNGALQDFVLYDRALSAQEVTELYDGLCSSTASTINYTGCDAFYLNSQAYYNSGTYTQTLYNAQGCDSIITLNLTIHEFLPAQINQNGDILEATPGGTTYQWIDCSTGLAINNATGINYEPLTAGQYSVIVNNETCSDTSACFDYTLGIDDQILTGITLYPNPAKEQIVFSGIQHKTVVTIYDAVGRVVSLSEIAPDNSVVLTHSLNAGTYTATLYSEGKIARIPLQIAE